MELYFLRHGRSAARAGWNGADEDRPLTEDGRVDVVHVAATLWRLGLRPDVIISSPLKRARETAELTATSLDLLSRLVIDERVGEGFGLKRLRRVLAEHSDAASVMLVGHEPDLSGLICKLSGGQIALSKGALARVDVAGPEAEEGVLQWLLQAELLTAQALAPPVATLETDAGEDEQPYEDLPTAAAPDGAQAPLLGRGEGGERRGDEEQHGDEERPQAGLLEDESKAA